MQPIERVTSALREYDLRSRGNGRWEARCPVHGGNNKSTLSVGVGNNDAVLVKCWSGCTVHEITHALGLELHDLFPGQTCQNATPKPKRIGLLSDGQALRLIGVESELVWVAARNLAAGHELTSADLARLDNAANRIAYVIREVRT